VDRVERLKRRRSRPGAGGASASPIAVTAGPASDVLELAFQTCQHHQQTGLAGADGPMI
jgi:hypothetical protein